MSNKEICEIKIELITNIVEEMKNNFKCQNVPLIKFTKNVYAIITSSIETLDSINVKAEIA